jgi:hypothetical protein
LLEALALAGGLGLVRFGSSCCCAKKRGATCPMRARCDAGQRSCSLDSSASTVAEERSIPAVIEAAFRLDPRRGARGDVWNAPRSPIAHVTPPELPPPRPV